MGCAGSAGHMKVTVQIKFSSEKPRVISFGEGRYLVYLASGKDDSDFMDEFKAIMSHHLGTPPSRILYKGKQGDSFIFDVD